MPHHGREIDEEMRRALLDLKLGATGKYPDGKLGAMDEGEIRFAVASQPGYVHINFGKPVAWLSLRPQEAAELGDLLRNAGVLAQCAGRQKHYRGMITR